MTSKPYFYIIKDLHSGKRYAGAKWADDANPDTFMHPHGYQTSSSTIHHLIERNGLGSFKIETIITDFGGLTAKEFETEFLQNNHCSADPEWFNRHNNNNHRSPDFESIEWKQMMLDKYGYDNYSKIPEVREAMSERVSLSVKRIKEKDPDYFKNIAKKGETSRIQTNLEKYGVDNPRKSKVIKDKIRHTKLSAPQLSCPTCGEKFKYQKHLQNHIDHNCSTEYIREEKYRIMASESAKRQWDAIPKEERYKVNQKGHATRKLKYPNPFRCEKCGKEYKTPGNLKRHLEGGWGSCITSFREPDHKDYTLELLPLSNTHHEAASTPY